MGATDIFEIRMSHPAMNALGSDLLAWLNARLDEAGERPILLTGSEGAFSAGLNLVEVAGLDRDGMEAFLDGFEAVIPRLYEHPAPMVACVNGHAIAGGCVLMQCADWRVVQANPRTRIGLNEVALGVCFPPRTLNLLCNRLGSGALHEALLGAGLYSPEDAVAHGLADAVSADAEADARTRLEAMAGHPRQAYSLTKATLRAGATDVSPVDEQRFREQELPMWSSDEMKQRVLAVLGKA